jgi:hypothetical protein
LFISAVLFATILRPPPGGVNSGLGIGSSTM